uniref:Uncharacterized protein n=1 Tax=Aegilops tauschii subsp. strangulata TaxID=200361 RepID=A0A453FAR3_AEGTS
MTSLAASMREFGNLVTDQQTIIASKVQHSESRCLYLNSLYLFIFCERR